ncbi:tail protein X [Roseibium sediminis]|uniref:tail protein X n=1 Tax=Roseibium sediminis TaxID=1775174 RepID=UPI00123CEE42|nr:tail protein X [Roseibium sediminis]
MRELTIKRDGVTLDTLLGMPESPRAAKLLAKAYELNRGIADGGLFLPVGAVVKIPDEIDVPEEATIQFAISLFS